MINFPVGVPLIMDAETWKVDRLHIFSAGLLSKSLNLPVALSANCSKHSTTT